MRQVLLMLAIHDHGTLHAAARHLGMTQSTASKMLHELETAIGEILFEREGRGLRLNPAGQAVMNACRGLCGTMSALSNELSRLRQGCAEKIFIGSIMVALPEYLSDALLRIKQIFPLLSVDVTVDSTDRLLKQLRDGCLDIVIGHLPRPSELSCQEFISRPIGEVEVSILASPHHPLVEQARRGRVSFAAIMDYPWILHSKGSPSREIIDQECINCGLDMPTGFVETSSLIFTVTLLMRENMLAITTSSIAAQYVKGGLLSVIPYDFTHKLSPWGSIVRRNGHTSPAKDMLLELLHSRDIQETR
jgi:DNA-binding transcriptional LysR family regulator